MNLKTVILSAISVFLLSSCEKEGFGPEWEPALKVHYLYIDKTSLQFGATSEQTQIASISSTETSWSFSGMPDWLSVSPLSGSNSAQVSFTATENQSPLNGRTAVFSFASTEPVFTYQRSITATQSKADIYIQPGSTSLSFKAGAGQQTLAVTSNVDWTASATDGWVTLTPAADKTSLTVSVQENLSSSPRSTTIHLQYEGSSHQTISLTQAPPSRPVTDESSISFQNTGGTYQVPITSDVAWTATTNESWLQLTPQQGTAGKGTLTIEATPNNTTSDRTGYVFIYIGSDRQLTIEVNQPGLFLRVNPSALALSADKGSGTLQVESNTYWSVVSKPDWLTLLTTEGRDSAELTVTTNSDNWSLTARTGILRLSSPGINLVAESAITQAGRIFPDLIKELEFDEKASSQVVNLETDGQWIATSSDQSWLTVTPAQGTGKAQLTVSVTTNTNETERSGYITVRVDTKSQTIAVTQQGMFFTYHLDDGNATFSSHGGTHGLSITTNNDATWTAESGASWLTLSETSGTGNANLVLTAADNPSIHERKAEVTFIPEHLKPMKFTVTQAARYLTATATSLTFFSNGGTSEVVTVNTDATYTITSSNPEWLTIQETGNTFTATATNNDTGAVRSGTITINMTELVEGESFSLPLMVKQETGDQVFTVTNNGKTVTFRMKFVGSGSFDMGSDSGSSDEKPVHHVTLTNDYYLGETEVTQELWEAVMGSNPSYFKGDKRPVETVSWNDCQTFIEKLNSLTAGKRPAGRSFHLPTEAEWEYAAKGGNKSKGYTYAGSNTIGDVAWYDENSYKKGSNSPDYGTHPVGQKSPNELELYDMSGNVSEWCFDWYGSYPSSSQTNPTGASSGSNRVNRGGSWGGNAAYFRSADRDFCWPTDSYTDLGLRLAL